MNRARTMEETAKHARSMLEPGASLCYGIECHHRSVCARYLAVDGATGIHGYIESCQVWTDFPLFISIYHAKENDDE